MYLCQPVYATRHIYNVYAICTPVIVCIVCIHQLLYTLISADCLISVSSVFLSLACLPGLFSSLDLSTPGFQLLQSGEFPVTKNSLIILCEWSKPLFGLHWHWARSWIIYLGVFILDYDWHLLLAWRTDGHGVQAIIIARNNDIILARNNDIILVRNDDIIIARYNDYQ